ncbi:MAG: hypothetical protein JXJ17_16375 [Anaerolineae bacterium]|nr:hypothetical protein [Anaerolineae bacterium]
MTQHMVNDESPKLKVNMYGVNTIGKHIGQALFTAAMLFLGANSLDWGWDGAWLSSTPPAGSVSASRWLSVTRNYLTSADSV